MTVEIVKEKHCCGCGACKNKCPLNAISMTENSEGFLFPVIDKNICTNCNLCEQACPVLHPNTENTKTPSCYAVSADDETRKTSTSGGVFGLIAKYIINNGGYVCGAKLADREVKHCIVDNLDDLEPLKQSKYVQSDTKSVYSDIKNLLDNGKTVLFSGTPCQSAGLKTYLKKDYENLYCLDFICHGVPSPKVLRKYIDETVADDESFVSIDFRDKNYGWIPKFITTVKTSKREISEDTFTNLYTKTFLKNLSLRKSCETCAFRSVPLAGDITIGDFWEVDDYDESLNDKKGISAVLINNKKGSDLFDKIQNNVKLSKEIPIEAVLKGNPHIYNSDMVKNPNRKLFFELLDKKPLKEILDICLDDKCDYLICNFWWSKQNYGALLTAYAMQEMVKSFGYVPKFLNDDNEYKDSYFKNFMDKYFNITNQYSLKEFKELTKNIKGIILGSDQILRYDYIYDDVDKYLLNFADINCKKLAISASFGIKKDEFLQKTKKSIIKKMKSSLKSFDYLSCREISGKEIYKDVFNLNSDMIIDPVFLSDKTKFENIANTSEKDFKNKIVTYILDKNPKYQSAYNYFERKLNKECYHLHYNKNSIEDFLKAIRECDLFLTDSFHGVCFALIFNKPFICVQNMARGNARFETLIDLFDIKDNFICDIDEIYQRNINFKPDYEKINNIIETEKRRCIEIIKKVLTDNYSNNKDSLKYKQKVFKMKFYDASSVSFLEQIFSIRKEKNKRVIRLFGIKIKLKINY